MEGLPKNGGMQVWCGVVGGGVMWEVDSKDGWRRKIRPTNKWEMGGLTPKQVGNGR